MITRQQLQIINRKQLGYPLDVAEKDYYLALAVKLIAESPLGETLVFKGGTAIHHCYLPQYRFSEDLDFTSLDRSYRDFYDLYLILQRPEADAAQALALLKLKEIRAVVSPAQMMENWQMAQQEATDDLRSIFCTRQVDPQSIADTLAKLQFDPLLPLQNRDDA